MCSLGVAIPLPSHVIELINVSSKKFTLWYSIYDVYQLNVWAPRCLLERVVITDIYIYIYIYIYVYIYIFLWRCGPTRAMASSFLRFLDHTKRRITVGRTPLVEWSARRRDFYLTTHNTHNRQTSMPPVGFEPTISAGERPQTYALDRVTAGTGITDI